MKRSATPRKFLSSALAIGVGLMLTACAGSSDGADSSSAAPAAAGSAGGSSDAGSDATDSPAPASGEKKQVAYLTASAANTWLAVSFAEMEKIAAENNVEITTFDAEFKTGVQATQIQNILAAKKYQGIIIASVDGPGVIPELTNAIDAGIQVAILNQIVGTKLDTADPQLPGVAISVLAPPLKTGERLGELAVKACEGVADCGVVYFFGIKGTPIDTAQRQGFDAVISSHPNIKIVAEAEGKYLGPQDALKSMQDVLQTKPNFTVVSGADQSIQGVALALQDAGLTDKKLISVGGSEPALEGIKAGTWFGTVFGAPATEGQLAMEGLIKAMDDGTVTGGVDPGTSLPDNLEVTKDNVDKFTAQWAG